MTDRSQPKTDPELARAIMSAAPGEARVLEGQLCQRFSRRILAYGRRHLADEAAARDLTQRVLLLTIEKLRAGQVREPEQISSFVLGASRTLCREIQRRGNRESGELPDEREAGELVDLPAFEQVGLGQLERCLGELPQRERTVVVLTYFGDQDGTEIGGAMGLAPGNVRVIRHRAIDRLRRCMGLSEEST